MQKPLVNEYRPYFQKYIDLVGDGDFLSMFGQQLAETETFFSAVPVEKQEYRYAENKWTPKEVLMHIIDTERVMSYRALAAARGDNGSALPVMDENLYASNVDVSGRTMANILEEFASVRKSSIMLLENLSEEQSKWQCTIDGYIFTPGALGYIMLGHVIHHIRITQERYL